MTETANSILCSNEEKGSICQIYLFPIEYGLKQIFYEDYFLNSDNLIFIVFLLGLVLISWHLTYKAILHYKRKISAQQIIENNDETRAHNRPRYFSRQHLLNRRRQRNRQNNERNGGTAVESPPADYRATGDCWDSEEIDPDYDFNNDMIVMMLHEVNEDADDEEENEVVRRIITAETDEDARVVAVENLEEFPELVEQSENIDNSEETVNENQGNVETTEN